MYQLFRHGIFQMDAEKAHNFTIQCLKLAGKNKFTPLEQGKDDYYFLFEQSL